MRNWRGPRLRSNRPRRPPPTSPRGRCRGDYQGLECPAGPGVFLVSALIPFQLVAFDSVQPRAAVRGRRAIAKFVLDRRRFQLGLAVVRSFPLEPVGRPARVRGLQLVDREGKGRPNARSSAANSFGNSCRAAIATGCHTSSARGSSAAAIIPG